MRRKRFFWAKESKKLIGFVKKSEYMTLLKISVVIVMMITVAGLLEAVFESGSNVRQFGKGIWDGIWWAIVTIATVGYGEKYPITDAGKFVAIALMFGGMGIISLLSATLSTIFITKKIQEGKGLQKVKIKNHVLICGWNHNVENIIHALETTYADSKGVVLVNNVAPEQIENIVYKYRENNLQFVRGDFTSEEVLDRANVKEADSVIIVPDLTYVTSNTADEKTILATLTIKTLNPKVRVYANILNRENKGHLIRANANDVVVSDLYSGFLLAMHVSSPGIPQLVDDLLTISEGGNDLWREEIPSEFVGKTFMDLFQHYYHSKDHSILIGLVGEHEPISLTDVLSDESASYLDEFIERKFKESGRTLGDKEVIRMKVNPSKDQIIEKYDKAILLVKT